MRALVVSADQFEDSELSEPLQQLQARGVEVDIAAPQQGPLTGKHGHRVSAGLALNSVRAEDYDLLLLPGGEAPASLRKIPEAVATARHFLWADKPVAAICHGPQLLIATGLMAGRTATCYGAVRQGGLCQGAPPEAMFPLGGHVMSLLDACRRTARRTFGIERLRPEQESAILAILEGRDALVALPTGFGKSLIYQVPAMILKRPTIVVSPLIALMADQERALRRRGVPVVVFHSRLRLAERRAALDKLERGGRLVVLTTPETLESRATAPCFERARPALLCVDEAHCISEWGHDFRPSYLRLGAARERLGNPVTLALTATATHRVREDIARRLGLRDPVVLTAPPHRENLRLAVEIVPGAEKSRAAGRRIRRLRRPGIIYCATTTAVDQLAGALKRAGIPVVRYHGKMAAADRTAAQRQFMKPSRRPIMVATSAFGMGIDKPNIRYIVHYQAPGSLEQYVQEIGRAGRDGQPAHCILLFDAADLDIQERLQALSRPGVRHLERLGNALIAWATEHRAPTAAALAYSAAIILAARAQGEMAGMAIVLGALLAVMGVACLFMLMAQEIHRAMGVTAQNVVLRLSGILLAAVAMQFVFDGLAASGLLAAGK